MVLPRTAKPNRRVGLSFYKTVLICIRCINKKNQILKNVILDKCGIIKLEK
ncbi:hypothetical protein HMPREF9554_03058 [Treponema phagedenis F0421]|nr:hypothetical protein HMPREF9554_03058 [Treponema phagedenis F0421]